MLIALFIRTTFTTRRLHDWLLITAIGDPPVTELGVVRILPNRAFGITLNGRCARQGMNVCASGHHVLAGHVVREVDAFRSPYASAIGLAIGTLGWRSNRGGTGTLDRIR